ncbi:uncharacterized protein BDZ99DRAFT_497109 [Mytilinidion resinicola]|uniref:Uncharacterized protein n=1 Tax=Mytilinidion resinicola TaxID=574789 RepID=A0A6A6YS20_9PEZI|nr:uncharacterized protein BDZ99DRAFT_497109 [Mytilinidion resinicola]KAF2811309.1 hypothetical protein BDZ99DRAFT_497109 [Mytilinidion resinicola]
MKFFTQSAYFITLGALAVVLLWGVSLWNGTVLELIRVTWYGKLHDGTPFKTSYTGIVLFDFPLSLLVAFFLYGTNGSDPGYQLFLIDAYSTLQSAFVWLYVEASRGGKKPTAVEYPIFWGAAWQAFGAAISLPFYYFNHLKWVHAQPRGLSTVDLPSARAIPISFLLGAFLPMAIGMLPTWVDRSHCLHQNILAAWQLDPVWVSTIQVAGVSLFKITAASSRNVEDDTLRHVRISYVLAGLSSTAGHLYAIGRMFSDTNPLLSFSRVYVPRLFAGPEGSTEKLMNGPWLFLQYDLIIIALSSLSWAYVLIFSLMEEGFGRKALPLVFLLGGLLLGPGGTVSAALFWREGELHRRRALEKPGKIGGRKAT